MIVEKKKALDPILKSSQGVHITAYLVNRSDLADLKLQIKNISLETRECLKLVCSEEEINKLLQPIDALLNDSRIMKHIKGNIGLFRTPDTFRIINIPIELETQSHVATSFHVKPLLKWMQIDRDFLFLGLSRDSIHLYSGNQNSIYKVASIAMPDFFKNDFNIKQKSDRKISKLIKQNREKHFVWLNQWLEKKLQNTDLKLFLAGDAFLIDGICKRLTYHNLVKTPVLYTFTEENINDIVGCIRLVLKDEAKKILERALLEFSFAEDSNKIKKNIFQVARAAVQGRIKKLIVADGINIFGKIDKKTGGLAIHPFDLDHEDDDILDDLAQTVLTYGGEVILAPRELIPDSRTVMALLDEDENVQEKIEKLKLMDLAPERA